MLISYSNFGDSYKGNLIYRKAICDMELYQAVICLFINIFFPGFGTILSGLINNKKYNIYAIVFGFVKFFTSNILCLGYILALIHSY